MLSEPRFHLTSMPAEMRDSEHPAGKIGFLRWFQMACNVQRRRHALAELPPLMLEDFGIDPSEAAFEASRPFGDFPQDWLR